MSEVSTWNAVDASNNATPPDGWPEGMQPSAVNDSARMMMGALRREHDRVTAQIGSVAGAINTTTINTTTVNASSTITASGAITGGTINSLGNASVAGTFSSGSVSAPSIYAASQLTSGGNLDVSGVVTAGSVTVSGGITAGTDIVAHGDLYTNNTLHAANVAVSGTVSAGYGNFSNTVTAGAFTTTGNVHMPWGIYYDGIDASNKIGFGWNVGLDVIIDQVYQFKILTSASDERLKTNIAPPEVDALATLSRLGLASYDRIDQPEQPRVSVGLVAQRLRELIPEAVIAGPTEVNEGEELPIPGLLQVDYGPLLAYAIGAIQQLAARVEELETKGGTNV